MLLSIIGTYCGLIAPSITNFVYIIFIKSRMYTFVKNGQLSQTRESFYIERLKKYDE